MIMVKNVVNDVTDLQLQNKDTLVFITKRKKIQLFLFSPKKMTPIIGINNTVIGGFLFRADA